MPTTSRRRLADVKGKPVLVNIWATWCAPCVKELPTLQARGRHAPDAPRVIAVIQDMAPRGSVDAFLDKNKLADLGVWHDPKMALSAAHGSRGAADDDPLRCEGPRGLALRRRPRLDGRGSG